MSLRTNSDAKQLLALLSPAVLDSLADLIVAKLQARDPLSMPSKQVVAGSNPVSRC
ncbi:MAG: hypothetical protein Q7T57_04205 [Dehalococcoidales bacterium]|nr:hypothetical protein [Dehalococcoidales bacterium]